MQNMSLECIIPLMIPCDSGRDSLLMNMRMLEEVLSDLVDFSKHNLIFDFDFCQSRISVSILGDDHVESKYGKLVADHVLTRGYIYFSTVDPICVPDTEIELVDDRGAQERRLIVDKEEALRIRTKECMLIFNKRIYDIILLCNLMVPGVIKPGGLFFNPHYDSVNIKCPHVCFDEIVFSSGRKSWNLFTKLKFEQLWRWYTDHIDEIEGVSFSQICRAFNAYSHLFSKSNDSNLNLFWAMLGLESLYCAGIGGEREQLYEKFRLFVGDFYNLEQEIKKLYAGRSNFIHGCLEIQNSFAIHERETEVSFVNDYVDAVNIASFMLISSIQKMIHLDLDELKFKYQFGA